VEDRGELDFDGLVKRHRSTTVAHQTNQIIRFASLLVIEGILRLDELQRLSRIVDPGTVKAGLQAMRRRGNALSYIRGVAQLLLTIARHECRLPEGDIEHLKNFVGKLPRPGPWVGVVGAPDDVDLAGFDLGGGVRRLPDPTACDPAPLPTGGRGEDPVAYFTTSGSTGAPKLAGHPQAAVVEHAVNVARAFDMRPGDAVHLALPLCGVFGFSTAFGMLAAGGTCVLEPVFDAERMARDVAAHHITHLVGGDDMLSRLMAVDPPEWPECRRGAIADFGGRAGEVARWADERGIALSGVYGSSELFALVSTWPAELPLTERVAAGGVPVSPAIEVRAVADGVVCPHGETGELQFRGYPVTSGYLGGPEVPVDGDGWFSSGDLGSTTADGFHYRCRAGDALRLRGFLVEPAEIESFLLEQDGVEGAKVVGAGGVAVAFVTLRPGALVAGEELRERCRAALAAFKVPARVEVIAEFPVTTGTNGTKIRAAELRERAAELLAP